MGGGWGREEGHLAAHLCDALEGHLEQLIGGVVDDVPACAEPQDLLPAGPSGDEATARMRA